MAQLQLARTRMARDDYKTDVEALLHTCRDTCLTKSADRQWTGLLQTSFAYLNDYYCGVRQPTKAAAAAEELRKRWPRDKEVLFAAACRLAACTSAVGPKDGKLNATEAAERQAYGDRAIEVLGQAIAHGFQDSRRLKDAQFLNPIRQREDFKKLVAKLEANHPKGEK
jgi:hypothetical protein